MRASKSRLESDSGGGFSSSPPPAGADGPRPEIAKKSVDASSPMTLLRATSRTSSARRKGPAADAARGGRDGEGAEGGLIEEQQRKNEAALRPLEAVKWISFGARAQGDRVTLRLMAEIR